MEKPKINLDELKRGLWSPQELDNVSLVIDFAQNLMNEHNFDYILEKYGRSRYVQHNRSMTDGVAGVVDYMKTMTKRFPEFSYSVKKIYADGEYVTLHSHVTTRLDHSTNEKKGFIIYDTWKVVDGEIVEHWDAIQPLDLRMRFALLLIGGRIRSKNKLF